MKSFVSVTRRGGKLVVTTKKYSLFSRASAWSVQGPQSTITLGSMVCRIAYDGSILVQFNGKWVEAV